ncbi:hypothetical protein COX58_01840 [archaeon CG_4_10_14_0_2_um_filter_Archaea_38_6]|nr:MAG: hypothetical protein COS83_00245 [archaeon CG07_land_8_20_14_0_80_38_8]PIU88354.1 MAG: hypothetical protein COS64_04250 [archaeon CG06_land_8_20_14_3_00_37_11]PJA22564.1 MAG: hypothetical protein COX58_01840 [archaeon CG_4_10_14_0_2_um_filter_Archaea_38_6]
MPKKFKNAVEKKREETKHFAASIIIFIFVILIYSVENLLIFIPWLLRAVIAAIISIIAYAVLTGVNNHE